MSFSWLRRFGEVRLHEKNESFFAVKNVTLVKDRGLAVDAIREARILSKLRHPLIVTLYELRIDDCELHMAMEFLPLSLRSILLEPLTCTTVRSYSRDLFTAISYCHGQSIMHRDIKPENLMIGKDLHMKLVDFGLARETLDVANPEICQQYSPQMVTLWYRAPEVLLARLRTGSTYGVAVAL